MEWTCGERYPDLKKRGQEKNKERKPVKTPILTEGYMTMMDRYRIMGGVLTNITSLKI